MEKSQSDLLEQKRNAGKTARKQVGGFGKAADVPCIEDGCCNYDYNTEILIKMRMLTFDGLKHNRLLS